MGRGIATLEIQVLFPSGLSLASWPEKLLLKRHHHQIVMWLFLHEQKDCTLPWASVWRVLLLTPHWLPEVAGVRGAGLGTLGPRAGPGEEAPLLS